VREMATPPAAARHTVTRQQEIDGFLLTEVATKLWLEQLLDISLDCDYLPQLQDGVILCNAMLEVNERSVPCVHTADDEEDNRIPFYKQKNNIRSFLEACEDELDIPRYGINQLPIHYRMHAKSIPQHSLSLTHSFTVRVCVAWNRLHLFDVFDLSHMRNPVIVVHGIHAFASAAQSTANWDGPMYANRSQATTTTKHNLSLSLMCF
jgi:hypothetical protein